VRDPPAAKADETARALRLGLVLLAAQPASAAVTGTMGFVSTYVHGHTNTIPAGGMTTSNTGTNNAAASAMLMVNTIPLTVIKTLQTYSDPVNGTINPKAIPGALVDYRITVTNGGAVAADIDSVKITDAVPANASLFVGDLGGAGSGPVALTDGSPPSGVNYTYESLEETEDDVSFSSTGVVGDYAYTPQPDAGGFDSSVTHIRINPKGVFNNSTSFQLKFRVQVQ